MKKQIIALFSLLLLVSCGTKEQTSTDAKNSSTESNTQTPSTDNNSVSNTESSEESKSESTVAKTYTFTSENIPTTEQSKYNNEFEFTQEGFTLFGDYIQRGNGDWANTIQMKKGVSYFYNMTKATGTITLSVLDKGDYTGVPTIYVGDAENPSTSMEWEIKKQESNAIIYQANFTNYFKISDESSYALYLNYIEINA